MNYFLGPETKMDESDIQPLREHSKELPKYR